MKNGAFELVLRSDRGEGIYSIQNRSIYPNTVLGQLVPKSRGKGPRAAKAYGHGPQGMRPNALVSCLKTAKRLFLIPSIYCPFKIVV